MKKIDINDIKAAIFDLDGTLVRNDFTIAPVTIEAIAKLQARGVSTHIATGRVYASAKRYNAMAGMKPPTICLNGGMLIGSNEEILSDTRLDEKAARFCVELSRSAKIHFHAFVSDEVLVEEMREGTADYKKTNTLNMRIVNFDDMPKLNFAKCSFIAPHETLLGIEATIKAELGADASPTYSFPTYLEIVSAGVNKGVTLTKLMGTLGISMENVLYFGDGMNDYEALVSVGYGVVMANAGADLLKVKGLYRAKRYDEDGVAQFINDLLL